MSGLLAMQVALTVWHLHDWVPCQAPASRHSVRDLPSLTMGAVRKRVLDLRRP